MNQRNILIGLGLVAAGGAAWWWWRRGQDDEVEDIELDVSTGLPAPPPTLEAREQLRAAFAPTQFRHPAPVSPIPTPTATVVPMPAPTVATPTAELAPLPTLAPSGPTGAEPSYLTSAEMIAPENITAPVVRFSRI